MSPEYLIPPSEITGILALPATETTSRTAVIWGTPTPAITRVVQMEPGPMPTFRAEAPASISSRAPSAVTMLPTMMLSFGYFLRNKRRALTTPSL